MTNEEIMKEIGAKLVWPPKILGKTYSAMTDDPDQMGPLGFGRGHGKMVLMATFDTGTCCEVYCDGKLRDCKASPYLNSFYGLNAKALEKLKQYRLNFD